MTVLALGSAAAVAFCFNSSKMSEICSPAANDTSAMDVARFRLVVTASSAPRSALCPCATAQTAALSLAPCTFRPVFTRLCVAANWSLVRFRFCRAIIAEVLVWMLVVMASSPRTFCDLHH